jgi:hypothetical protein
MSTHAKKSLNPLLSLPTKKKEQIFFLLRKCKLTDDALRQQTGIAGLSQRQVDQFFAKYADEFWTKRVERAANEANALIRLVRKNPVEFSEGVLAALGQEVFRQIASGKVEPGVLVQFTQLFARKGADDRAERALVARLEKQKEDMRSKMERALDSFISELGKNAAAQKAFDVLRTELLGDIDKWEVA